MDHLRELADLVMGRISARLLYAEKILNQDQAAKQLAKNVLGLLSAQNPLPLRELLKEIERRRSEPVEKPVRRVAEALIAFLCILRREKRLPSNTEINIEANRIQNIRFFNVPDVTRFKVGDKFIGDESRFWIYRIDSIDEANRVGQHLQEGVLQICPHAEWDELRWDKGDFSTHVTKPAGFSGLPRAKLGG